MKDARFHGTTDPMPGLALAEIVPAAARARALIARSKTHAALANDFPRVNGAAEMLDGLQYHFENYARHRQAMAPHDDAVLAHQRALVVDGSMAEPMARAVSETLEAAAEPLRGARHEVIAYLNVLGRYYYFARGLQPAFTRVVELLPIRHKVTAHRSIDMPKGESDNLRDIQAMALTTLAGHMYSFPGGRAELSFQVKVGDAPATGGFGDFIDICLERDHDVVSAECYAVLEVLLR
ncbi:MAG: hypothetical protein F9K40_01455 [Kofleriaceae bacterium]|nr:MAG: hypothetical protein F9K40_01455 [Kofleriaceae bacterium]